MARSEKPGSAVRGLQRGAGLVEYGAFGQEEEEQEEEEEEEDEEEEEEEEEEGNEEEEREEETEGGQDGGRTQSRERRNAYSRFLLTFAEPGEALRFVRAWHRREMLDERTNRTIVFHASALW
jgi:hypothetical protein